MLVLSRRPQESIIIGDRLVTITVLGIVGNHVRIGINAPKRIEVHRQEVFDRIQTQRNDKASKLSEHTEAQGSEPHEV